MTFRIAHVSDLHVLSHRGAQWRAMLFNKRIDDGAIKTIGAQVLGALGSAFHYRAIAERTECI